MGYSNGGTSGPKPGKLSLRVIMCVCVSFFLYLIFTYHLIFTLYFVWFQGYGAKARATHGQGAKPQNGKFNVNIT